MLEAAHRQNDRLLQTFSDENPDFGHLRAILSRDAPDPGHKGTLPGGGVGVPYKMKLFSGCFTP
jgi:hypothetical protein